METENMFEMKKFAIGLLEILEIKEYKELPDELFEISINHNVKKLDELKKYLPDLERDYLLEVFQFYLADRENKKQDYTPVSLSKLLSEIVGDVTNVADIAAGSGALGQQVIRNNSKSSFYSEEIDHTAVSFMMVNYVLRNIGGTIAQKDALSVTVDRLFKLSKGVEFSTVEEVLPIYSDDKYDAVVSNPPFNLPYEVYDDGRYPVKLSSSNANYTFIFRSLELLNKNGRSVFILPNQVLTSSDGLEARKYLLQNDMLEAVISMPAKMFFVTQIPVTVMVFSNNKKLKGYVKFIDQRKVFKKTIRKQFGEGENNSKRLYEKEMSELTDEHILKIVEILNSADILEQPGYATSKTNEDLLVQESNLTVGRYITPINIDGANRKLEQIVNDLIRISNEKTRVKFTINEKSAADIGLNSELVEMLNSAATLSDSINENNKNLNLDLPEIPNADKKMVSLSKYKVLKIEVDIKDGYIPEFIKFMIPSWKQLIYHWNEEEIRYLEEYRDALLPLLLNGTIKME